MKVEDNDLQLSSKYKNYQYLLDAQKDKMNVDYKKSNSDTIEAAIILNNNLDYFKLLYQSSPFLKRRELLVRELKKQFPDLDESKFSRYLTKQGFYSERYVVTMLSTVLISFTVLIANFILVITSLLNLILTVSVGLTLIFTLILVIVNFLSEKAIPSYRVKK